HSQEVSLPSGSLALTERSTGTGGASSTSNASSQPAGVLASSNPTCPPPRSPSVYRPPPPVTFPTPGRAPPGPPPHTPPPPTSPGTASATTALPRLARPGRDSDRSCARPVGSVTELPWSTQLGGGLVNPHSPQCQPSSSLVRWEPHCGQHQESSCHRWPAA